MSETAAACLAEARKFWKKDNVFGFIATPIRRADGTFNHMNFGCRITGKKGTSWERGYYTLTMIFNEEYPTKPPECKFVPPIFHPNVDASTGAFYIPLLDKDKDWKPNVTIKQILLGIQNFLNEPNIEGQAIVQEDAFIMYRYFREQYEDRVRIQAIDRMFAFASVNV